MKVIYISVNGRAYAEDINSNVRLVGEPDGLHPMQPSNVFVNDRHQTTSWGSDDSIALIWQGVTSPESYADGITKEFIDNQVKDDIILKLHLQKQAISSHFWRSVSNWITTGVMLSMCFGLIAVFGLLLYAVVVIFV